MNLTTSHRIRIERLKFLFLLLLCIQPLFVLVIKGWSSAALVLSGLICLIVNWRCNRMTSISKAASKDQAFHAFLLAFSLPFILIGLTSIFRQDIHVAPLDSPLRFLLAIPVFILIRRTSFDALGALSLSIALGLLITLSYQFLPSKPPSWDSVRMSSHFADPISFGYISLAFAFSSFISILHSKQERLVLTSLKAAAFCAGIYMSVMSLSRTGWFAVPFILVFALYLIYKNKDAPLRKWAIPISLISGILIAAFFGASAMKDRLSSALTELRTYSAESESPDTSVGLRLTFLRMASDMIQERPLLGHGDTQIVKPEVPERVREYASNTAIDFALSAGFHNELVTAAVQYGLFSATALAMVFLVPLGIYWRGLQQASLTSRHAASIGIVFTLIYLASSVSTEVFGLKYTISLYAMTTAILCGIVTRKTQPSIS